MLNFYQYLLKIFYYFQNLVLIQDLKRKLSIANIPYLVVVKNNQIVFVQNGHTPGAEEELLAKLKSL